MKPCWESLAVFWQSGAQGGFAVEATLEIDGVIKKIEGIFDDPYFNAELGEYEIDISHPRFTCEAFEVRKARENDRFILDGTAYVLASDPQEDGTGLALLALKLDLNRYEA